MTHMEKARALRARSDVHFNCCQAVLVTFAGEMGLTEEQAFRLGSGFGSGMRCGSVCGTLTGALMVLGAAGCPPEQNIALLRQFRQDHGDINCAVLLKTSHDRGIERKTHCDGLVFEVVEALEKILSER